MYCVNCGVMIRDSDAYCSQCGMPAGQRTAASARVSGLRLTRSLYDKRVAGVCGGLAHYLAVDPALIRLICLVASVCYPPLILGYLAAWIVLPREAPRLEFPISAGIPQPQG